MRVPKQLLVLTPVLTLALLLTLINLSPVSAADGDLDSTFGTGGQVVVPVGLYSQPQAIGIRPDGRILTVGGSSTPQSYYFKLTLIQSNPNGSLDPSFGNGGQVVTDWSGTDGSMGYALSLQPDGKTIVAGAIISNCTSSCDADFLVARYNPDGSLDPTFGSGGHVLTDIGSTQDVARALALTADGHILLAGSTQVGSFLHGALARYNPDGSLDPSFGTGGTIISTGSGNPRHLAMQPDGKIVLTEEIGNSWVVERRNPDGSADSGFGDAGRVYTDFAGNVASATDVAIQPDNRIVVAGYANTYERGITTFAVVRYNPDGSLDPTFGDTGRVMTYFYTLDPAIASTEAYALALDTAGRIVVAGNAYGPQFIRFALMRLNGDGSLDASFGSQGLTTTAFDGRAMVNAVAIQGDGKIIAAGTKQIQAGNPGATVWALTRYLSGGLPTPTATPSPTSTATPSPTPVSSPTCIFTDVCPGAYYYTPVQYLVTRGAISGYSDGSFRPGAPATRGQLCKIIVAAEGWTINTTGGPHFSDVPPSNPFYSFIETAYNRGVVNGYSDGSFHWGAEVTRGQLSKIIVNAQGWDINTAGGPHFTDVPRTNPFYSFIETAYSHGSISGYSDQTFRWGSPATRGQISKIVYFSLNPPAR